MATRVNLSVVPLKTLRIDINPLRDLRYTRAAFDMCCRTRYAHCVSADLYHIEFEHGENISNLLQGKYIEPSKATAYRQNQNSFCEHRCSACQEKRTEIAVAFSVLSLSVGTISIEPKTVL